MSEPPRGLSTEEKKNVLEHLRAAYEAAGHMQDEEAAYVERMPTEFRGSASGRAEATERCRLALAILEGTSDA